MRCLVVPLLFRADSETNLFKHGKKDDQVARYLSWQSADTVSERPWASVPVGYYFSSAVTFGGSVWVHGLSNKHQGVHVSLSRADSGANLIKWGEGVTG